MKLLKLCGVLVAVVAFSSSAFGVISLVYEEGPLKGQALNPASLVELTWKIGDFDIGTGYAVPGAPVGYSGNPGGAGIAGAVTTLDGLGASPSGALPLGLYAGANGNLEDTWGIGRITRIEAPSGAAVWTPAGKGHELNAIFFGEQDIFIEALGGGDIRIDGVNFRIEIYSGPLFLDATGGTAVRTAANTYPTVNLEGQTLELSMVSLPGFINAPGVGAGLATEFESRFNFTSNTGEGDAWLEITGGAAAGQFDHDPYTSANAAALAWNPLADITADIQLAFDADPNDGGVVPPNPIGDWLVESDDPMKMVGTNVPEPLTMLGLFMGLGGVGAYIRKRRMA